MISRAVFDGVISETALREMSRAYLRGGSSHDVIRRVSVMLATEASRCEPVT